jgi:hypothetical protein
MKISLCIMGGIMTMAVTSSAALINYTFDESNVYAATLVDATGVILSDISYVQGSQSDTSTVAGVAYESNISTDNMFVVCSLDTGASITSYSTDVSRLEFSLAVDSGTTADLSAATLSLDLSGITDKTLVYRTNLRLAYNVNGAGWVTDVQKQVDTSLVASNLMDTVLFDDSTDALLEGYGLASGAFVHEDSFSWSLSVLGTLSSGDVVEFALLIYDQRNATSYYTAIDNIQISDLVVETSSATLVNYTFDESNPYAAYTEAATGLTVTDIAYLQGATSDTSTVAGVAYESNVPADNLFAVCSLDTGASTASYSTDVSRLEFSLAAASGSSADFSGAALSVDLAGITDKDLVYRTSLRLAYNINGAGWATDTQRQVDTTLTPSNIMDTVLYDNATDALLEGYGLASGAFVHEDSFTWSLSAVGALSDGDAVEIALLIYDQRNAASYYTAVDNIQISDIVIETGGSSGVPPAPIVSFGSSFGAGQDVILWDTVQGSGYVYSVYYSTDLMDDFQPLETNLADTVQIWTNATTAPKAFYQIRAK